ncbi:hypothetical protein [Cryobacterium serini]|uniref:Uncharacterized protein n=1 Tax=Cryobacterium serini TaxID=1259201 RepID=A0A4V3IWL0_9MICO|nr:hypothetical protein [Cryobacterium serini]TFD85982.1 hypothetical protein E3T51_12550 [Cryobacterium serini]
MALTMALAALGPTGAYFSDTAQGKVTGSLGSIKITGSGGMGYEELDLNYTNLLPGAALQTQTVGYENTGRSNQDVWVVFNDADALHALNNLGHYGAFKISRDGTTVFNSTNLSDGGEEGDVCTFTDVDIPGDLCHPLPKMVMVASNVAPRAGNGADGHISFGFAYPDYLGNGSLNNESNETNGGAWNNYPLADPTASGLPYQIVATQVGQEPGVIE